MKIFLTVLIFFLAAFSGMAAGLLFKRKGLRGGCGSASAAKDNCQCKSSYRSPSSIKS